MDPAEAPIPVQPGQHYSMGGIETDKYGRTRVPGLYAAGECACVSVHGANRLGGNSLLECVVFGARAGAAASKAPSKRGAGGGDALDKALREAEEKIGALHGRGGERGRVNPYRILGEMQGAMWENVGIFREEGGLKRGVAELGVLSKEYREKAGVPEGSKAFDMSLVDALMIGGMLEVALVVAEGALRRNESRGGQFRRDHPGRDDEDWLKHTLAFHSADGPRFEYKPVVVTKWPPKEREY